MLLLLSSIISLLFLPLSGLVGWLVVLGFETVFQSISGRLRERGRRKRELIDERKMSTQPPPAPTASVVDPCPTLIQISRTPWHWKFTQNHRTTRPPHPPLSLGDGPIQTEILSQRAAKPKTTNQPTSLII